MRTIMLWGGGLGFFLAGTAGLAADRPLDLVLRDAAVACLGGAWLLRWWWTRLERALTDTIEIRRRHADEQAAVREADRKAVEATAPASGFTREPFNPAVSRAQSISPLRS